MKKNDVTYDLIPVDRMVPYAASDTRWTLALHDLLAKRVADERPQVYAIEKQLIPVLMDMEYRGALLDKTRLNAMLSETKAAVSSAQQNVYKLAGREFNISSGKQLIQVFENAGISLTKRTNKGNVKLDKVVLAELSRKFPLAEAVLDFRGAKNNATTITSLLAKVDDSGYIHTSYNSEGAATGRFSSSSPNLQNISRPNRAVFVPPAGQTMVSIDLSQIELRLAAHCSRDLKLIKAFERGEDIHQRTAVEVFGETGDASLAKRNRKIGKELNFATIYGAGWQRISAVTGESKKSSQRHLESFYAAYEGLTQWKREVLDLAKKDGYVENLYGRRRWLPILRDPFEQRNPHFHAAERQAVNSIIQGSAADLFKLMMIEVAVLLAKRKAVTRMVLTVHDELVFYVPLVELELVHEIKEIMETPSIDLRVPLVADVSFSTTNWKDMTEGMPSLQGGR